MFFIPKPNLKLIYTENDGIFRYKVVTERLNDMKQK